MIAELIYLLCAATSLAAAALLTRHYRYRRSPQLFWSSLAFAGFSVNNIMVFVDLAMLPQTDMALIRALVSAVAMFALVYGLTREMR